MFGRKTYTPPPQPPQVQQPQPKKEKSDPIINPFGIFIWICLFGSIVLFGWYSGLGMNMQTTVGYVFLMLAAIGLGFLFLIGIKTNGFTELKAFLYGRPILVVHRKDGQHEFVLGKYGQGIVDSRKYGKYFVNPDSVKKNKKSGASFIHVVDSIGTAVTEPFVKAVNVLKKQFGFKDIYEIENAKKTWSRCENCGFEGVPLIKLEMTKNPKEPEIHEQCKECGMIDKMQRIDFPTLKVPLYEDLDYSVYDGYFDANQNPDRLNVVIKREVQSEMEEQRGFPVKLFGILLGVGILIFLVSLGLVVLLPKLTEWVASSTAVTVAG